MNTIYPFPKLIIYLFIGIIGSINLMGQNIPVQYDLQTGGIGSESYIRLNWSNSQYLGWVGRSNIYYSTVSNPIYPYDYTRLDTVPYISGDTIYYKYFTNLPETLYHFVITSCSTSVGSPFCISESQPSNVKLVNFVWGHTNVNITSNPVLSGTKNTLYQYDVNATTSGTYTIHYAFVLNGQRQPICPPGMTINQNTGVINWTPSQTGVYDVSVKAYLAIDSAGSFDTQSYQIAVKSCPNPTYIGGAIKDTFNIPIRNAKLEIIAAPDNILDPGGDYTGFSDANGNYLIEVLEGPYIMHATGDAFFGQWYVNRQTEQTADSIEAICGITNKADMKVLRNPPDSLYFHNQPITITLLNEIYSYDGSATSVSGRKIKYTLTTKPSGMQVNDSTGLVEWTPTVIGGYHCTLKAYLYTDSVNSFIIKDWYLQVKTCGQNTYIKGHVTDNNGVSMTSGTITVQNISGIDSVGIYIGPINAAGNYVFMIDEGNSKIKAQGDAFTTEWHLNKNSIDSATVVNMTCGDTNTVNFQVTRLSAETVSFTTFPSDSAVLGTQYRYSAHATCKSQRTIFYTLINKPSGMVINDSTGVIIWTPKNTGRFNITLKAYIKSDSANSFAIQDWWISTRSCRTATIMSGSVKDGLGNPLHSGTITIYNESGIDSVGIFQGTINTDGFYSINTEEGKNKIYIEGTDFKPQWYNNKLSKDSATEVTLPCGQTTNLNLVVATYQTYSISGKVTDSSSGNPISNARIKYYSEFTLDSTTSDGQGNYTIRLNEKYSYISYAFVPTDTTYIPQYYNRVENVTEATPLTFSANLTNIDFKLKKTPQTGNSLFGKVLSGGNGIPAQIIAFNEFPEDTVNGIVFEARTFDATNSGGSFAFYNLNPGKYILLAVPLNIDIVPGYFFAGGNAVGSWTNASLIDITNNSQVGPENINLIPVSPTNGIGLISGRIITDSTIFVTKHDQVPLAKEGIAGAIVVTKDDKDNVKKYNISNIKGSYTIDSLGNGKYQLDVDKVGFAPFSTNFVISDTTDTLNLDCDLTKQKPVSVEELFNSKDGFVLLYPNPAENNFTIEFNSESEKAYIKIYNILGNLQFTTEYTTGIGAVSIGFTNIKFTPGMYFVQITSGTKKYNTPVMIK